MQTSDLWHKLYLHGIKITTIAVVFCCLHTVCQAQTTRWIRKNNPNYDDRKLTYGFLIGLHTTAYKIKHSELYADQSFDTLYAVEPTWSPGFSLGFIVNYKIADFFDLRLTPKVAFYEHKLTYLFTGDTPAVTELVETTMVEFPVLLKYKSERRGNMRMYMIGGIKPGIEASGKKELENITGGLEVKGGSLNVDFGFGFDMYYPLFKFSPEIRFSKGIINVLDNTTNRFGQPLETVTTNTITVYLLFQ